MKKQIKSLYFEFILRPLDVFWKWCRYSYGQLVLLCALRGIKLPGFEKCMADLPPASLAAYKRQLIVFEIKGWQFSTQKGPFWYRRWVEFFKHQFHNHKFLLSAFFKLSVALFFILIPIGIFVLIRIVLPVPERVPFVPAIHKVSIDEKTRSDEVYKDTAFSNLFGKKRLSLIKIKKNLSEDHIVQGFWIQNKETLSIEKKSIDFSANTPGVLHIQYDLFSKDQTNQNCTLEVLDENRTVLASTADQPRVFLNDNPNSLWNSLSKNLTPSATQASQELKIKLKNLPKKIFLRVSSTADLNKTLSSSCTYLVSDFSFERTAKKPLKRKGVLFIVVDGLNKDLSEKDWILPHFNQFTSQSNFQFLEHRTQSNVTWPSLSSLMSSHYPKEQQHDQITLPAVLKKSGYRVAAIGPSSLFLDEFNFGLSDAFVFDNPNYQTRLTTEKMGSWLEQYGYSPFFLYLHYNAFSGPYKPPFADIHLRHFLEKPFGLHAKQELYLALGRTWDKEFQLILEKIKSLGLQDDVDIIVTSSHGIQIQEKNWNYLLGVDATTTGAYADKGHSLFDEELRVPLVIKKAHDPLPTVQVSEPTAHLDLFPTIAHWMTGQRTAITDQRGLDWSVFLEKSDTKSLLFILKKRDHLYFEGPHASAVLSWNPLFYPMAKKYIRQNETDHIKLLLNHSPWRQNISWNQKEMFTSVDLKNHREQWDPAIDNAFLKDLRKTYFQNSVYPRKLQLIPKYDGFFSMTIEAKDTKKIWKWVQKNQPLLVDLGDVKSIKRISFAKGIQIAVCPSGTIVQNSFLVHILKSQTCPFFLAPDVFFEKESQRHLVLVKEILSGEGNISDLYRNFDPSLLHETLKFWNLEEN